MRRLGSRCRDALADRVNGKRTDDDGCHHRCLVVGNEQDGVSAEARAACSGGGVRIEMAPGVDSLNVGVATAVLLNGFREREGAEEAAKC